MKEEFKEKLKNLDNRMYNLNANLSALVYIQKLKTLKEAEEFMGVINGEIAKWIKEVRDIHKIKIEEIFSENVERKK